MVSSTAVETQIFSSGSVSSAFTCLLCDFGKSNRSKFTHLSNTLNDLAGFFQFSHLFSLCTFKPVGGTQNIQMQKCYGKPGLQWTTWQMLNLTTPIIW